MHQFFTAAETNSQNLPQDDNAVGLAAALLPQERHQSLIIAALGLQRLALDNKGRAIDHG
jgi:hypothetical protein